MTIFTREGTVSRILPHRVEVTVISVSACLHCRLKENCTVSDCRSRNILVETDNPQRYAPGSRVTVLMDSRLGWWSVFYAYILPLILVLGSLFAIFAGNRRRNCCRRGSSCRACSLLSAACSHEKALALPLCFPPERGINWGVMAKFLWLI